MKKLTLTILAATALASTSHAVLTGAGDIAFTGFNADGDDGLAFTALVDIGASESIFFNDNEWTGAAFNTGEGEFVWTPGVAVSAGTVITFSLGSTAVVNIGSITGDINLGNSDEAVFAYIGTAGNPTAFLSAIANDLTGAGATFTGTGLTNGTNAIDFANDRDVYAYTGSRTGAASLASYNALINNPANWVSEDGSGNQDQNSINPDVPFSTSAFTAVPEPATATMFLGGFGVTLWMMRRRKVQV